MVTFHVQYMYVLKPNSHTPYGTILTVNEAMPVRTMYKHY